MAMGYRRHIWTKELDDELLAELASGKNMAQIETSMRMSHVTMLKRLKEMGFGGFRDARKVLSD